ncbi:MAG: aspartate/glutamate racemase family protein [Oscillospiraceae bacterium]|nr:aspartate/glutamate racemase family protein [Oscillospiraceae bacterium]
MKTIGLLGGMSWESTVTYYQVINETVKNALGGLHSAKILLYSVEFDEIERCQSSGRWDKSAEILSDAAKRLETAGADFIVICTNTMHKVAPEIEDSISVPLLHIAQVTAKRLKAAGISTVGLLGSKYTMTQDFYVDVLVREGIEVLVPEGDEIDRVNSIIFDELCVGVISGESRQVLLDAIDRLSARGAQGVILGCTELGLLVKSGDTELPVFDTALIHAEEAALEALRP